MRDPKSRSPAKTARPVVANTLSSNDQFAIVMRNLYHAVVRKTDYFLLFGGLLVGAGLLRSMATRCASPIVPGGRLLVLGDSLAVGTAPFFAKLAAQFGMDSQRQAKVGTTIAQWLNVDTSLQPTLAIVSLGTNDTKTSTPVDMIVSEVGALVSRLQAGGAEVVWMLPPALPFSDRGITDAIQATGIRSFDSRRLDIPRGPDGLHPTVKGYAQWASAIWRDLLCDPEKSQLEPLGSVLRLAPIQPMRRGIFGPKR